MKINDRPVNFVLSGVLRFTLNEEVVNFKLNASVEIAQNFYRLLETGFYRLLEDGSRRLLE